MTYMGASFTKFRSQSSGPVPYHTSYRAQVGTMGMREEKIFCHSAVHTDIRRDGGLHALCSCTAVLQAYRHMDVDGEDFRGLQTLLEKCISRRFCPNLFRSNASGQGIPLHEEVTNEEHLEDQFG